MKLIVLIVVPTIFSQTAEIWCLLDGKAGHEQQCLALAHQLQSISGADLRCFKLPNKLPKPDNAVVVIGAGHSTHFQLLKLKWLYGLFSIVLMRPSLPGFAFDLCIIPQHDRPLKTGRSIVSRGPLSLIKPAQKLKHKAVILVGSPTKKCNWEQQELISQINHLISKSNPLLNWSILLSRRTSHSIAKLIEQHFPTIEVKSAQQLNSQQFKAEVGLAEQSWVSADSVNMVFESIQAGCHTGLLLNQYQTGRICTTFNTLLDQRVLKTVEHLETDTNWNESAVIDELSIIGDQVYELIKA